MMGLINTIFTRRVGMSLILVALLLGMPAAGVIAQDATPEPETTDTAAAEPATTNVKTLVLWYSNAPEGDFLTLHPLALTDMMVASLAEKDGKPEESVGKVEFPDDAYPIITLGDTVFEAYPRVEGDIAERWTWFDDYEFVRPATMVMQIAGIEGEYAGHYGTATFISRDEGGVGGVIVFALRPPADEAAAEEQTAATPEPVEPTAEPEPSATPEPAPTEAPTEEPVATEAPTEPAATEAPGATPVATT